MGSVSSSSAPSGDERVVICLVGLTGEGKSCTGNSLCGDKRAFIESRGFSSETRTCAFKDYAFNGQHFRLLDTPGLRDTHLTADQLHVRFKAFADLAPRGVDAFLFVCRSGRFGGEKADAFNAFEAACGKAALEHTILLFTHVEEQTQEELRLALRDSGLPRSLRACLEKVQHRCLGIENRAAARLRELQRASIHDEVLRLSGSTLDKYRAHVALAEAEQWRRRVEEEVNSLNWAENQKRVHKLLGHVLDGASSREDVENELRTCSKSEADQAAREAAEREAERLKAELARESARRKVLEKRSFGQRERLAVRIKHILHDYEAAGADGSLVVAREFLQNADDHCARRFAVVVDERSFCFSKEKLFHDDMELMQGPSLVFAMDSECTDEDLGRIQELGDSWKRKRFDQVGRFGLGMNTMYAFSDQPVLRARYNGHDRCCFFDPLEKFAAKDANGPGVKWDSAELRADYPGQLAPLEFPEIVPQRTVFRFPLRRFPPYMPLKDCNWPSQEVMQQLEDLARALPTWMCFLRNVAEVQILCIDASGAIKPMRKYRGPQPHRWKEYQMSWPADWEAYARQVGAEDSRAWFTKVVTDEVTGESSTFDIASCLLASSRDSAMSHWASSEFALSPMVSVAYARPYLGSCLFSGLPVDGSQWPTHIDACFDVSSSRSGVALEKPWNQSLIVDIMPYAHRDLIMFATEHVSANKMSIRDYLRIFPINKESLWSDAVERLYSLILEERVLPAVPNGSGPDPTTQVPEPGTSTTWAAPVSSYWLPPRLYTLDSYNVSVRLALGRIFDVVDCLDDARIELLSVAAGKRELGASLLGDLLRERARMEQSGWTYEETLAVLRFMVDAANRDGLTAVEAVHDALIGTRLLCLTSPERVAVFGGEQQFFDARHAPLLPYGTLASPRLAQIAPMTTFPGFVNLTPDVFLNLALSIAFSPDDSTRLNIVGVLLSTPQLSTWHGALLNFFSQASPSILRRLLSLDWPIIRTDDALVTGRYASRVACYQSLRQFYVWDSPPQPPVPNVLFWASDVDTQMVSFTLKLTPVANLGVLIGEHVIPQWRTNEACDAEWAQLLRDAIIFESVPPDQFATDLTQSSAVRSENLPAIIMQLFASGISSNDLLYRTLLHILQKIPAVSRDCLLHATTQVDSSRLTYPEYWLVLQCAASSWRSSDLALIMDAAVLPIVRPGGHDSVAWASPSSSYLLVPKRWKDFDSYIQARTALARVFNLCECFECFTKKQIVRLQQAGGCRQFAASLLSHELRLIGQRRGQVQEWTYEETLAVFRFVVAAARRDGLNVHDALMGTPLLCLTSPERTAVFGSLRFYDPRLARLRRAGPFPSPLLAQMQDFHTFPGYRGGFWLEILDVIWFLILGFLKRCRQQVRIWIRVICCYRSADKRD